MSRFQPPGSGRVPSGIACPPPPAPLVVGRFSPAAIAGATGRTLLVVDDPEALVKRALAAGAGESSAVGEEHGWLVGRIVDPFGHQWEIGRPLDASP